MDETDLSASGERLLSPNFGDAVCQPRKTVEFELTFLSLTYEKPRLGWMNGAAHTLRHAAASNAKDVQWDAAKRYLCWGTWVVVEV
jgi:hypothetical protein